MQMNYDDDVDDGGDGDDDDLVPLLILRQYLIYSNDPSAHAEILILVTERDENVKKSN